MKNTHRPGRLCLTFAAAAVFAALAAPTWAQLRIGQTAGFSGPVAAGVKETTEGAKLYFDAINAKGGINGQKIELESLDDKFDPKLAAENARTLITNRQVLSLFLTRGTPHTQAIMPLLDEFKVPLVGPSTGAMALHKPVHPWLFNVRATYQREAERAVQHLSLIGIDRIGVVHVDDSFGADLLEGAQKGFSSVSKQPLFIEKFDRAKPDFSRIAPIAASSGAQAVLFIGSGVAVTDGIAEIRKAGSRAQIITNSNNASGGFIKSLGANAPGTIVTQVFPNERSLAAPIVKEADDLAKAKGLEGLSPAMLEGFAAAKVLVAGLQRAGDNPTRAKLREALEGLKKLDLGGLELSYSPTDHTGLEFVDLSIVDASGRFRR
ncbi:MAG: ABC transporter substrate-binding protein [Hydrogenophaga sp.]|jgi:ABC-type branched-subunit amino acid transport system substrate-binding protein|uniref:ABC transporter substrate-binding protein n=1 Tax=Hydrogenophaga sp. TaxID=1904254 RepID=UPI00271F7511|nr:ABC transporter substrate-binding protein [Hydrogenophaga sp.]MDO9479371.1 ABC transporter substrate-binding protein [Hydrogenophaga sp.]MDO9569703.1 ABC transporter substrate-binding protein [Hydrogenophaga sp.]MDP1894066.1 ABC transporter substrate-binding protein [Hydrogenophaga sp.]MDP2219295.1 ABC transporter substrate-binding protein [Hydrogenophaga sp.]MDP3374801.1 ABC transporter substrate-binding protein [Hydrogenophaga sp.]